MPFDVDYVRKYLKEHFNSVYEQESEERAVFMLPFSGYNISIRVDNRRDFILCALRGILIVQEKHKSAVLEKAMALNYSLIMGRYGYDPEDGELAFEAAEATEGFHEPWDAYDPLLERLIRVVIHTGTTEARCFQEMNYTGNWPEKEEEQEKQPDEATQYRMLCQPVRAGMIELKDVPEEKLGELLDIIIKVSINQGRDKIEDYPEEWQALLRERLGPGSGTEI